MSTGDNGVDRAITERGEKNLYRSDDETPSPLSVPVNRSRLDIVFFKMMRSYISQITIQAKVKWLSILMTKKWTRLACFANLKPAIKTTFYCLLRLVANQCVERRFFFKISRLIAASLRWVHQAGSNICTSPPTCVCNVFSLMRFIPVITYCAHVYLTHAHELGSRNEIIVGKH